MFDDNLLAGDPPGGSLIYRIEGDASRVRRMGAPASVLTIRGGPVAVNHPAQYDRAWLRLKLRVLRGAPLVAIAHQGKADRAGQPNPRPGLGLRLRPQVTEVVALKTGRVLGRIPAALPRGRESDLGVYWDLPTRQLRVDLPAGSYALPLPHAVAPGGFAVCADEPATELEVRRLQVVWPDARPVLLYDRQSGFFDLQGQAVGAIPPPQLPDGMTHYQTTAIDLRRHRSLIVFGGTDLNAENPASYKGWAVRDWPTGRLDLFGPTVNGCTPYQGGGGVDGFWLLQAWVVPSSTCWLDWNAYDRGDRAGFVVPHKTGTGSPASGAFVGYHDPTNALDGSLARYLRIDQTWRGALQWTVHPNLRRWSPLGDDRPTTLPTHPRVSHTGPAGMPMQMALRDRERAWYEQWAYLGNHQHVQTRGFNLFSQQDDWATPLQAVEPEAAPFDDYANMAPSLLRPGELYAFRYRFTPAQNPPQPPRALGFFRLRMGSGAFAEAHRLPFNSDYSPCEVLADPAIFLPGKGA